MSRFSAEDCPREKKIKRAIPSAADVDWIGMCGQEF
jgi:hypothetical protein